MVNQVNNLTEFIEAIKIENNDIYVASSILIPYSVTLSAGVSIHGSRDKGTMLSFPSSDGIALTKHNKLSDLVIQSTPVQRAIYISSSEEDLSTMTLEKLTVTGQVQLLTRTPNKTMELVIDDLDIPFSDSRNRSEKPLKYGVVVDQGALTIFNYNQDSTSAISAVIKNVSIGRKNAPVLGSGIFIAGFNETGGSVEVKQLVTKDIYSNGMIPFGQPNMITGGIFILTGAHAQSIHSQGTVTTYGVNDMVLDVWGEVDNWITEKPIESFGTSGIGFVNFGTVHRFQANDVVVTHGSGARGFNQYDGTIDFASFKSITTYGDGSIGMQFSKPVGEIIIEDSITTSGDVGDSLVKGEIQSLKAIALSLQPGGEIENLSVGKNIATKGKHVHTIEIKQDAFLHDFSIGGEIKQEGNDNPKVIIEETLSADIKALLDK
ncbi:hypothetical protein [Streptococcus agalactiae]|uniref:hypothetical protein n=1 Tax=Streptococcus agalactiae TaxID=1311 RepID=UPI00021A164D|nr:hypothetical protein [Streptococcus agalactiae]EGS28281.1 hypothetical protein FSLSAGS3026_03883 [Streptococcus agalactiae FSL S3-026]EPV86238.1 hypothetical protein SAG0014_03370 [Streptococcus agalactiae FSL S3-586]